MTKVTTNKGTETKSNVFPWDIFKSDIIYPWSKKIKVFQWLLKFASINFITKQNASKEHGQNQTTFNVQT